MRNSHNELGGLELSINTTEDCNLACRYCYEIHKRRKTMNIQTVEKFFRVVLQDDDPINVTGNKNTNCKISKTIDWYDLITIDLIGGDALMKPELCDQILTLWQNLIWEYDTFLAKKARKRWVCTISTNGTLFENKKVRDFCLKWSSNLCMGISIDGCPTLHNYNRPYVDGRGSMPVILKWWPWLQKNFPDTTFSTKATMDKTSIPYLFEGLKFMYEKLGIWEINQNFIMEENHCTNEDYKEYIRQIQKCIDWILETPGLDQKIYWSVINRHKALCEKTSETEWTTRGWCGSGHMPALSIDGGIYPCFRWLPHTTDQKEALKCGDIENGLNHKERFTEVAEKSIRSVCSKDPKCRDCIYEKNCPYCIGGCYSEFGEFKRTTYICTITKIECEMAKRYWNRYNEKHGIKERYEEYELPV